MNGLNRPSVPSENQAGSDWRLSIPEPRRRVLRLWLWSGAALTFLILIVGGITRLTQSGLSIVDWAPIMGAIPPLNEAQWQEAFDRYRQYPEYQQLRRGMTMSEFQFIFFWEYLHRLVARLIGLVFLIPFLFFVARGYLNRPLVVRSLILFVLGGLQGFLGWYMVSSGLVDQPHVSQFRLGIHLSIAFAIFGGCLWFARDLAVRPEREREEISTGTRRWMQRALLAIGALFSVQVFWGALVAGLKAGYAFNTFPLMNGRWLPPNMFALEPALLNFVENPFTVQWVHRVLGTLLLALTLVLYLRVRSHLTHPGLLAYNRAFLWLIVAQFGLGVSTLLLAVPVVLGVAHQAMAMVIFGVWLDWLHRVHNMRGVVAGIRGDEPARSQPLTPVAGAPA
jgi:heme a synthase